MAESGAAAYRLNAAHCVEIAQGRPDAASRAMLLTMAKAWMALADQAERNRETILVYETPDPQQPVQQQQQPQPIKK